MPTFGEIVVSLFLLALTVVFVYLMVSMYGLAYGV